MADHSDGVLMVSLPEAARRVGLGLSKTKYLVAQQEIRSVLIGKRRLVPVAAIQEFVDRVVAEPFHVYEQPK